MKQLSFLLVLFAAIAMSCSSEYKGSDETGYSLREVAMDEAPAPPPAPESFAAGNAEASAQDPIPGQMLIKNIYLGIEVEVYELARKKIDSLVRLAGGWISSENFQNYEYNISNDMAIRVPSPKLESLVQGMVGIAKIVNYQRAESTDVTEDYIDVQSRLSNMKKVEDTFVRLLRRTDSIEEILKIETKLAEVRGNIESMEGRLKYLKDRVQFSTIYLNLSQKLEYKYVPDVAEKFGERLKKSLHAGWKGFVSFTLFIIGLWPLWIIGAIAWVLIIRYRRKKFNKIIKPKKKEKEKEKKKNKKQQQPEKGGTIEPTVG